MRGKFIGEFDDDLIVIGCLGQLTVDIDDTVCEIIKKYHLLESNRQLLCYIFLHHSSDR